MAKNQYRWTDASRYKVKADIAAREFARIRKEHGNLTAQVVVDAARPEDSPLHPDYEWNDFVAAEAYRRQQAATQIRALVIVTSTTAQEHREYVLVKSEETPNKTAYVPMVSIAQQVDLYQDALQRLMKELKEAEWSLNELKRVAAAKPAEPERMARIALATQALAAAKQAVAAL